MARKALGGIRGIYEKRGWFYYQPPTPKEGGARPAAVALRTRDLVAALAEAERIRDGVALDRTALAGTVKEWLGRYYRAKGEDSVATRRCREQCLNAFAEDLGNPRVGDLSEGMIERWRDGLAKRERRFGVKAKKEGRQSTAKPLSGATVKTYTITLRAFVNWLRANGAIRHDPMGRLRKQTRVAPTRRAEFLTEQERERLLAVEMPDYLRLMLHLGFFCGLREGEMLAMTPQWVWLREGEDAAGGGHCGSLTVQEVKLEREDGSTGVWRPKTRELRTIPLHPRMAGLLRTVDLGGPYVVAPHKPLWPALDKRSKRFDAKRALHSAARRAGLRHVTFHMLRHSFATHLAMKGVALAEIAGLLGDSLKVTEDHYAGFCPSRVNPLEVL
jgi:integrase